MIEEIDELSDRLILNRRSVGEFTKSLELFSREGFWIGSGFHINPNMWSVMAKQKSQFPLELRVQAGNIIHECRTCLDALAVILANRNGKTNSGVYFPISEKESDFYTKPQVRKKFSKFSKDDQNLLLSFRPFEKGNDNLPGNMALVAMHKLDKERKHVKLTAQTVYGSVGIGNGWIDRLLSYGGKELGDVPVAIAEISKKSNVSLYLRPHYRFANQPLAENKEVTLILNEFIDAVEAIVQAARQFNPPPA